MNEIYTNAMTNGTKVKAKELKTKHGLKDKYQEYFITKVNSFISSTRGAAADKQARINGFLSTLPSTLMSPVWRVQRENFFVLGM